MIEQAKVSEITRGGTSTVVESALDSLGYESVYVVDEGDAVARLGNTKQMVRGWYGDWYWYGGRDSGKRIGYGFHDRDAGIARLTESLDRALRRAIWGTQPVGLLEDNTPGPVPRVPKV